jgi:hypothetical protein
MSTAVKVLLIVGLSLLAVGPCSGVGGTVLGILEVYETMALAGEMGDPSLMAAGISKALVSTVFGLVIGGLGLLVTLIGLIVYIATRPGRGQSLPPQATPLTP